jgi:hypothetical protein
MSFTIPQNSIINKSIKKLDYYDSFNIIISNTQNYSVDYLTAKLFSINPKWVNTLLKIRNAIVEPLGLKTGDPNPIREIEKNIKIEVGSKDVFFTVLTRNENEIVMSEDDKHLYFRTSVLKEYTENNTIKIHLTTIVIYHNVFGKIYFFFVKPFHRIIMKAILKLLKKSGIE